MPVAEASLTLSLVYIYQIPMLVEASQKLSMSVSPAIQFFVFRFDLLCFVAENALTHMCFQTWSAFSLQYLS